LKQCPKEIALRMVWHWWHCDEDYGRRVAEGTGIDLEEAKSLPPLPGKPAPGENRTASTYTSGNSEAQEQHATVATQQRAAIYLPPFVSRGGAHAVPQIFEAVRPSFDRRIGFPGILAKH
jgi:catalase-related immune-responsive protein